MAEEEHDRARAVSRAARIVVIALAMFLLGVHSAVTQGTAYRAVMSFAGTLRALVAELPNLTGTSPVFFLQPARQPGSGVTVNDRDDGRLIAIAGFFDGQNGIRLMRRDGTILASWVLQFSRNFPDTGHLGAQAPQTDWNVDLHGMVMNPDGSVVVNYEYSGLIKLDRCGRTEWTLNHPTHHSVEHAEGGGYWVPGWRELPGGMADEFPPFTTKRRVPLFDNLILRVTEDGRIAEEVSVPRVLYDNGLEPLLTATGAPFLANAVRSVEVVHLNKIAELPARMAAAFPRFEAGDLMLSLREQNMVVVVDPDDWRVKWYQVGPWRRQHDPEFMPDGTITVFNNNMYHIALTEDEISSPDLPRISEIVRMDPQSREWSTAWGNLPGEEMLTVIRGKQEPREDGGFLITEFEAGRAFETDGAGRIVWEYINRYDDTQVAEITEARSWPAGYFTVPDWSCPQP